MTVAATARKTDLLPLAILTAFAAAFMAYVTAGAMGVGVDSVDFIAAGENLAAGKGLMVPSGDADLVPLTHFPPLVSFTVAAAKLARLDALQFVRWLQVFYFAGSILLAALLVRRHARSVWPAVIAGTMLAFTLEMLSHHSLVATEPPYIFFTLATFYFLDRYVGDPGRPRTTFLLAAALAASLTFLARYPGIVNAAAGAGALLLLGRGSFGRRLGDALVFGLIACVPMGAFMGYNKATAQNSTNRQFVYHPIPQWKFRHAKQVFSRWFIPANIEGIRRAYVLPVLAGGAVCVVVAAALGAKRRRRHAAAGDADFEFLPEDGRGVAPAGTASPAPAPALADDPRAVRHFLLDHALFAGGYLALVVVSMMFFDAAIQAEGRILFPVYLSVLLVGAVLTARALAGARRAQPALFGVALLAVALLVGFKAWSGGKWALTSRDQYKYYTVAPRVGSRLFEHIRANPKTTVYSNDITAIYYLAGHPAYSLPTTVDYNSWVENPKFAQEMEHLGAHLEKFHGLIVYFAPSIIDYRWDMPTLAELRATFPLRTVLETKEGVILEWDPTRPRPTTRPKIPFRTPK